MIDESYVRLKFFGLVGCGWSSALCIKLFENQAISYVLMGVFFTCAICTMLVRCEKCGVYVYRYNSKHHGLPHPKCFSVEKKCPSCGIKRK
jgi:hypothetical protein